MRDFIIATGEVANPEKATQNYFDRYSHETLTKNDLIRFVDGILAAIEGYLTDEVSLGEVIDLIKPVKAG